jgi:hypothetical protein
MLSGPHKTKTQQQSVAGRVLTDVAEREEAELKHVVEEVERLEANRFSSEDNTNKKWLRKTPAGNVGWSTESSKGGPTPSPFHQACLLVYEALSY